MSAFDNDDGYSERESFRKQQQQANGSFSGGSRTQSFRGAPAAAAQPANPFESDYYTTAQNDASVGYDFSTPAGGDAAAAEAPKTATATAASPAAGESYDIKLFSLDGEGLYNAHQLQSLNESRNVQLLQELGGVEAIAQNIGTDVKGGLADVPHEHAAQKQRFGENVHKQPPMQSLIRIFLEALKEPILIFLLVLSAISIVLGVAFPEPPVEENRPWGWIEGAAIIMAVLLVSGVTAVNDYSKERKFRALNAASKEINIKVIRGAVHKSVLISELLTGDIVELENGDQVPADGLVIESFDLKIDESVMTGETDLIKKNAEAAPFLLSGCQVAEGYGKMLVTAVGPFSEWGKTLEKLSEGGDSETPLEDKLNKLAAFIGKFGIAFGVITSAVLIIGFTVKKFVTHDPWSLSDIGIYVRHIVIGVTVVVVAVPEGLPLAVTLSLAYSVKKMMKDNNLVRHLQACETMGGATNICSDKTGTLTLNQMRVVQGWFADAFFDQQLPAKAELNSNVLELICDGISVNSKANIVKIEGNKEFDVQGNKTEGALVVMVTKNFERDYKEVRNYYEETKRLEKMYTFSSAKKRASCIVRVGEEGLASEGQPHRLYTKGASEIVLGYCSRYLDRNGQPQELTEQKRKELLNTIESMANQGLRTICCAYRPLGEETRADWEEQENVECDMTCVCIVGIKDPLRREVPSAVEQCKKSGIFVRMVTGDNIVTARFIARDCGILDERGTAMEGPDFRKLSDEEVDRVLPTLQVLARSSPSDKHRLVSRLIANGEVVAVTGDGTNDAPALKEADVGLAMGLSGTQVAKEASDIIILDDNFKSIVKSVLWGRSIFENIRKFLVFQMTVNVVALAVTVITALTSFIPMQGVDTHRPPLTAVQLLWVNLIMDTMAALALATEPPIHALLDRKPHGRKEGLLTPNMWVHILGQALYQLAVLLGLYYAGPYVRIWSVAENDTVVFNAFVMCQVFNEFNARKINNEWNILQNIWASPIFLIVIVFTCVFQFLIVSFGGRVSQTLPIGPYSWIFCVIVGFGCIPYSMLLRAIGRVLQRFVFGPLKERGSAASVVVASPAQRGSSYGKLDA